MPQPIRSSVARFSKKKKEKKRRRKRLKRVPKSMTRFAPAKRKPSPKMEARKRSRLSRHALLTLMRSPKRKRTQPTKARCTPLPSAITTSTRKPSTNTSRPPEANSRPRPPLRKTTASFFPAKHAPRAPALPNLARIFPATPRASAAIPAPASSGLIAAADAIATTAAEIIAAADHIVPAGGPAPGAPPRAPGGHSGPSRRPQLISEMLKAGQDIVIQIAKEPLGKKGARITSHVALHGRFLVYMPTIDHIGVSRKIASAENRSRLRLLVGEARGAYPGGFIVRTAAGGASDEEIRTDIEFLCNTWNEIKERSEQRKSPALLHRDLNLVERILRDYVSDDFTAIWIDSEEEYGKVVEFVSRFQPKLVTRVKLYSKDTPIFEEFGIQHELDKALRAKVWLKSGGYIVINHTEALVAIDVNTGKFVGKGSTRLEDTIVKTNLEAVKEIVRQIRLRDLGGIIVVDFIDMEERRNRERFLSALQQALEEDKAPSKALSFNEFGLVCITRKRTKQALERVLCQPCPYCTGSGMVKSIPTLCYEIQGEARKMATADLEQTSHKHIIIQSDATLHWEQYDIY